MPETGTCVTKFQKIKQFCKDNRWFVISMSCICLAAFLMRMICCFWGSPLQLHPDEQVPVDYAMELLARHSYEVSTYNRPDHFEIKCDAVIFTAYSLLRYHTLPYKIVSEHKMEFYVLARMYTALFGTALIPLCAAYTGLILRGQKKALVTIAQLTAAAFVAFSAIFVQHSAYATPDIVLTFFVILFAYFQTRYLENGEKKDLIRCAVIAGVAITIKYPAALLCLAIAGTIIFRALLVDKKPVMIIRYGFLSILAVGLTVFAVAPNLITNVYQVYVHIVEESGGSNLGAGGLSFGGNLIFYFSSILNDLGLIVVLFFVIGIVFLLKNRSKKHLSLLTGLLFWVCMSALSLHWVRWGIPFYPFYHIIVAIGISACIQWISRKKENRAALRVTGVLLYSVIALILLNTVLCGLCITKFSTLPDLRYSALKGLEAFGITPENTLYEAYTPFAPTDGDNLVSKMHIDQRNHLIINQNTNNKKYLMVSGHLKKWVYLDPDTSLAQRTIYEWLAQHGTVVFHVAGDGNYQTHMSILKNSLSSLHYLASQKQATGNELDVYELPLD